MPVRYRTLSYIKREVGDRDALTSRIRLDIVNLIFDELAFFQLLDAVKVYYDASPTQYRLLQVADLLCTLELTEIKYQAHEQTATDEKVFGTHGRFKKLYLRIARRKLL